MWSTSSSEPTCWLPLGLLGSDGSCCATCSKHGQPGVVGWSISRIPMNRGPDIPPLPPHPTPARWNVVFGFHVPQYPQGHQPTDYWRWIKAHAAYPVQYSVRVLLCRSVSALRGGSNSCTHILERRPGAAIGAHAPLAHLLPSLYCPVPYHRLGTSPTSCCTATMSPSTTSASAATTGEPARLTGMRSMVEHCGGTGKQCVHESLFCCRCRYAWTAGLLA